MSSPRPSAGDGPFLHFFNLVYFLIPYLAILYYFVTAKVSGHHASHWQLAFGRVLGTVSSWVIRFIFATYLFDAIVLGYLSVHLKDKSLGHDNLYTLASVICWFYMAVVFRSSEEQATTSWYPLGGYSIMYLFTESFLLASPWRPGDSQKAVAIVYLVVKIFRLLFIALLVAVTVGSCLVPKRCQPGDEETLPLLRDDGGQGTQRCYNTIPNGTEPQGQNSDSQGTEASKEPNNTVKFLLPYFWPQHKPLLQLLYGGIGICLIVERILNVLIPLQLALITDVLVQSPGTLPWKQILVLITFTALNSPGGLPVAREYMWLPLHKHSYHKISTDVFNKITTSFSEPPGSKRSRDLWETVKHGRSFGHAVRSVMFQLSPAVVDIALATLVLGFVFGFPMMAIIAVVLCGLVLTILIFPMRNRGAWQMAADVDEERNVFCEAVSSHRDAVEYYEKFRYEAAVMDRTNSTLRCFQWFHLESVMQSFLLIVGFTGACLLAAYKVAFDNMPLGNVVMLLAFCVQLSIDLKSSKREMIFVVQRYWDAVKLVSLLKMKPSIRRSQNRARPARVDEPIGPRDNPFTTKYGASALNVAKLSAEHPTRIGTSDAFANIHSTAQFNDGGRVQEGGEHNLIHFQEPESVHPAAEISERDRAHQSDDGNMAGFQELADVRSMALINEGDQLQPAEDSAEPESQKSAEIQPANEAITGGRAATDESYESKELQQMNETTSGDRAAIGEIQSMDEINGADEIQQKDDQAVVEDLSKSPDVHPEGQNIDGGQVQQKDEFAEIEGPHVSAEGPADKADQEDEVAKVERSLESTDCHEHIDGGEAKVIIGPWESSDEEQIDGDDAAVIAGPYESDDEEHIDGGEAAVIAGSCESTESHKEHINGDDVAVTAGPCESADGEHIDGEQINGSEYQQKDDSAGIGHSHDYAKTPASVGVGKPLRASAKPFVFPTQENLMDYFPKEMLREGSLNNGRAPTKKMAWKPDAPEFIPASQRSVAKKSQTMEEHKSANNESEGVEKLYLGRYEIKKENRGGVQNENVPTAGGDKKKDMEIAGDGSHGFGSVLEQSTNGVVLRSPRKPRKRNKGKRKVVFRRSLTKSEPSGVGLARFE